MKRANPRSGARSGGGGGGPRGWEAAKRGRHDGGGGWRGREPVVKWSHAEAMKKKPTGAAVAGDGGGCPTELLDREKAGPCGSSSWSRGFGASWSVAPTKEACTATSNGGEEERAVGWTEAGAKKARPCEAGEGGGEVEVDEAVAYEWRWTKAVSPEILALMIRGRVAADEVARGAAMVCRAWREAAAAPDMWGDVDIEAWCRRVNSRPKADAAVRRLVARAQGTLQRLCAYRVGDAALAYVAASGKLLNVLQIPMSEVSDQAVLKHAECLPALRELDISNCLKITSRGIEALGQHCKLLVQLKRNMPPPEPPLGNNAAAKVVEDEALAVANTMPMLEQLELAYGLFSDLALNAILTKCPRLRTLNILGCWNVWLEGDIEERCCALESFREPWEPEYFTDSGSGGDYGDVDDTDSDSDGALHRELQVGLWEMQQ
ncbi:hypothetical protein ACP4OV_031851 [Aristida adscensionis]